MDENSDIHKAALADRTWKRQQITNLMNGPISYLMGVLAFADVLKLAKANVGFSTPNWDDEMFRLLGWKDAYWDDFGISATMNGHVVRVSNRCEKNSIFAIRHGGKIELKPYQHLTGQIMGIEILTPIDFAKTIISDTALIASKRITEFHVCSCYGDNTPLDKQCMCNWCHTCNGVKPEYAEKYRNSQWYKETNNESTS